jgi:hypothetical protein
MMAVRILTTLFTWNYPYIYLEGGEERGREWDREAGGGSGRDRGRDRDGEYRKLGLTTIIAIGKDLNTYNREYYHRENDEAT